jgi:hypothetical protein
MWNRRQSHCHIYKFSRDKMILFNDIEILQHPLNTRNWLPSFADLKGAWTQFALKNVHAIYNFYSSSLWYFIMIPPVRIRVRIDSPHPLVCRKRRLNGAVLRMRPEKPRSRVTAGVAW